MTACHGCQHGVRTDEKRGRVGSTLMSQTQPASLSQFSV